MRKKTCVRCGQKSRTLSNLCRSCDFILGMDEELKSTLSNQHRGAGIGFSLLMLFLALLAFLALLSWIGKHIPVI